MRTTFEPRCDMACVDLTDANGPGSVAHTEPVVVDLPNESRRLINLDFDHEGRLIGIEVDGARAALPEGLLRPAASG
jgi:uncharacterized protein YuzE